MYEKSCYGCEHWYGYDEKGQVIFEADSSGYPEGIGTRYNSDGKEIMSFCGSYGSSLLSFLDSKGRTIYLTRCNNENERYVFDDKSYLKYEMLDFDKEIRIKDYEGGYVDKTGHAFDDSSIHDKDGKLLYSYEDINKEHKWFEDDCIYVCRHLSEEESEWLEYDENDNLVRKIIFSNKSEWVGDLYYHEYDNKNNLVHLIEGAGNQEWRDYDESGRLIHSKDIWGKETIFEYDDNNTLIHKSEMICGQVWNDYVYNESEKLLSFKSIWGEEGIYICDDENILKNDNLPTATHGYYYDKELKILFSKDKCGKETKYEYDEEGGCKEYEQNDDGEFVLIDQGKCVDNDYDVDFDFPDLSDIDLDF